eukprot:TRINITY_DN19375_c0_g1_i1.p1 TRINITY_DN19375_c0_g1~~TRINITY_DN19375_c0_g1_i1.p1  ORF type:complete len:614 (+),score=96.59 TRINITY_DN19375_c0_g1_i1:83-1924(+)
MPLPAAAETAAANCSRAGQMSPAPEESRGAAAAAIQRAARGRLARRRRAERAEAVRESCERRLRDEGLSARLEASAEAVESVAAQRRALAAGEVSRAAQAAGRRLSGSQDLPSPAPSCPAPADAEAGKLRAALCELRVAYTNVDAERKAALEEVAKLRQRCDSSERERQSLAQRCNEATADAAAARRELRGLQGELQRTTTEVRALWDGVAEFEAERAIVRRTESNLEQTASLAQKRLSYAEDSLRSLKDKAAEAEAEKVQEARRRTLAEHELQVYEERLQETTAELQRVSSVRTVGSRRSPVSANGHSANGQGSPRSSPDRARKHRDRRADRAAVAALAAATDRYLQSQCYGHLMRHAAGARRLRTQLREQELLRRGEHWEASRRAKRRTARRAVKGLALAASRHLGLRYFAALRRSAENSAAERGLRLHSRERDAALEGALRRAVKAEQVLGQLDQDRAPLAAFVSAVQGAMERWLANPHGPAAGSGHRPAQPLHPQPPPLPHASQALQPQPRPPKQPRTTRRYRRHKASPAGGSARWSGRTGDSGCSSDDESNLPCEGDKTPVTPDDETAADDGAAWVVEVIAGHSIPPDPPLQGSAAAGHPHRGLHAWA